MNKMKHTPGPWEYSSGQVWADGTAKCVARRSSDSGIPPEQRSADMRLCAAAPELLDALRYMVENAEADGWSGLMLRDAKAAISKAEGRD